MHLIIYAPTPIKASYQSLFCARLSKVHCESTKTSHYNLAHNFAKCWLIFTILSLTNSLVNLQQNIHQLSRDTLVVLLHYLVKYQCSKNCYAQDLIVWSVLSCKTQPLKTVVKKSVVFLELFSSLTKRFRVAITKFPRYDYASAATEKKRFCSKMLLHMISGRSVTSCL